MSSVEIAGVSGRLAAVPARFGGGGARPVPTAVDDEQMETLLAGIISRRVQTTRLTVNVLEIEGRSGVPVLFVHGNVSSSLFWQPLMLALPERFRPIAMDLRGFGDTDPEPVDATRGVRDYSDDVQALLTALDLPPSAPGRLEPGRRSGAAVPARRRRRGSRR